MKDRIVLSDMLANMVEYCMAGGHGFLRGAYYADVLIDDGESFNERLRCMNGLLELWYATPLYKPLFAAWQLVTENNIEVVLKTEFVINLIDAEDYAWVFGES